MREPSNSGRSAAAHIHCPLQTQTKGLHSRPECIQNHGATADQHLFSMLCRCAVHSQPATSFYDSCFSTAIFHAMAWQRLCNAVRNKARSTCRLTSSHQLKYQRVHMLAITNYFH